MLSKEFIEQTTSNLYKDRRGCDHIQEHGTSVKTGTETDLNTGLTSSQVEDRILAGLVNNQTDSTGKTYLEIIRDNVLTFFNLINVILATLIILVGSFKNLLFMMVVITNTGIGIFQELRAKRTLDKLALISAVKVRTVRNGQEENQDIDQLVKDDIMILTAGNQICADAIMRQGSLEVNESLLTGESDTVFKQPGDLLYSGSFVVSGKAYAQVEHIGEENYAYQITVQAKALKKHPSELRDAINKILKIISILIVPLGVGFFASQYYVADASLENAVVGTVAAVLGMIPEGLVLLTSVALAVGAINLSRRKTLVHELYCMETLARVDVLCLDKTGTLTEGSMQVREVQLLDKDLPLEEVMGNLVNVLPDENSTFLALKSYFERRHSYTAASVIPFSSERKYSGVYFQEQGTYIIGAFEFMFPDEEYQEIRQTIDAYTNEGIRVIALAHSRYAPADRELPVDLFPQALLFISDIVRSDARETLEFFAEQGVALTVISGDHPATVSYVASQAGLDGANRFIDATTLQTPAQLREAVENYRVFGRVTPGQKKEIIQALQAKGHTVAMTGDGVNDVPALKEADCSIAMAQGCDAAKDCSNLVLLDSNFSSMPRVVNEGRRVINNIQSAASLFLVKTIYSLILTALMLCFSTPYPFMPIHLTLISACGVGIPTFLLSFEPNYAPVRAGFLRHVAHNALTGALTIVFAISVITLLSSRFGFSEETRTTMCMITTGITCLYMIRQVYPLKSLLRKGVYFAMCALFLGGLLFLQDFLVLTDLSFAPTTIVLIFVVLIPSMIQGLHARLTKINLKDARQWIRRTFKK